MQEFEDNFDDELDFTPPAEDTPSVQSPAEVFTLSVPSVALPAPAPLPSRAGEIPEQVVAVSKWSVAHQVRLDCNKLIVTNLHELSKYILWSIG